MHVFVERVFEKLVNYEICPKRFEILKEKYGRMLKNYKTRPLYTLTGYYLNLITSVRIFYLSFCCLYIANIKNVSGTELVVRRINGVSGQLDY